MASAIQKTVLITGAGSGIGAAIARSLASAGYVCIVTDTVEDSATQIAEEINAAGGEAHPRHLDVRDPAMHKECVDDICRQFGSLSAAVNNAGIAGPIMRIGDIAEDQWRAVMDVNLDGVFYGMKYQLRCMERQRSGVIVNVSSMFGVTARPEMAPYITSKHGVVGLTRTAALDYAQCGIRVNAVAPGVISTPLLNKHSSLEEQDQMRSMHPIGRLGQPEDVANLVKFLLSDESAFVTGATFSADGGYTAQ